MKKTYLTNPITDELIRDGIIEVSKREELRIIKDKEGNTHQEIAVTIRYKDPRKFVKSFPDFILRCSNYLKVILKHRCLIY